MYKHMFTLDVGDRVVQKSTGQSAHIIRVYDDGAVLDYSDIPSIKNAATGLCRKVPLSDIVSIVRNTDIFPPENPWIFVDKSQVSDAYYAVNRRLLDPGKRIATLHATSDMQAAARELNVDEITLPVILYERQKRGAPLTLLDPQTCVLYNGQPVPAKDLAMERFSSRLRHLMLHNKVTSILLAGDANWYSFTRFTQQLIPKENLPAVALALTVLQALSECVTRRNLEAQSHIGWNFTVKVIPNYQSDQYQSEKADKVVGFHIDMWLVDWIWPLPSAIQLFYNKLMRDVDIAEVDVKQPETAFPRFISSWFCLCRETSTQPDLLQSISSDNTKLLIEDMRLPRIALVTLAPVLSKLSPAFDFGASDSTTDVNFCSSVIDAMIQLRIAFKDIRDLCRLFLASLFLGRDLIFINIVTSVGATLELLDDDHLWATLDDLNTERVITDEKMSQLVVMVEIAVALADSKLNGARIIEDFKTKPQIVMHIASMLFETAFSDLVLLMNKAMEIPDQLFTDPLTIQVLLPPRARSRNLVIHHYKDKGPATIGDIGRITQYFIDCLVSASLRLPDKSYERIYSSEKVPYRTVTTKRSVRDFYTFIRGSLLPYLNSIHRSEIPVNQEWTIVKPKISEDLMTADKISYEAFELQNSEENQLKEKNSSSSSGTDFLEQTPLLTTESILGPKVPDSKLPDANSTANLPHRLKYIQELADASRVNAVGFWKLFSKISGSCDSHSRLIGFLRELEVCWSIDAELLVSGGEGYFIIPQLLAMDYHLVAMGSQYLLQSAEWKISKTIKDSVLGRVLVYSRGDSNIMDEICRFMEAARVNLPYIIDYAEVGFLRAFPGNFRAEAYRVLTNVLHIQRNEWMLGLTKLFLSYSALNRVTDHGSIGRISASSSSITAAKMTRSLIAAASRRRYLKAKATVVALQSLWRMRIHQMRFCFCEDKLMSFFGGIVLALRVIHPFKNCGIRHRYNTQNKFSSALKTAGLSSTRQNAAVRIQSWWKSVLARFKYRSLKKHRVELEMAEFIQSYVRMSIAQTDILNLAAKSDKVANPDVQAAALRIRNAWVAKSSTKKFNVMRQGLRMLIFPVKKISSKIAILKAETLRQSMRSQADESQKLFTDKTSSRISYSAAIRIQTVWRGYFVRQQYLNLLKAIWATQTLLHSQLERRKLIHIRAAVVKLQRWWRAVNTLRGSFGAPVWLKMSSVARNRDDIKLFEQEENLRKQGINHFLSLLNRPSNSMAIRKSRRKFSTGCDDVECDSTPSLNILADGYSALLKKRKDHQRFEIVAPTRVSEILDFGNASETRDYREFYIQGWMKPLLTFLQVYLIKVLSRIYRNRKPKTLSPQVVTTLPKDQKALSNRAPETAVFGAEDFSAIIEPIEGANFTGDSLLYDRWNLSKSRSSFELSQIVIGSNFTLCLVTEDLLGFLGCKRSARVMPFSETSFVRVVFGWGSNHNMQLTYRGMSVRTVLGPPGSRRRDLVNRCAGVQMIRFRHIWPARDYQDYCRKIRAHDKDVRRKRKWLRTKMNPIERMALSDGSSSSSSSNDDSPKVLHRIGREVDYTFRIQEVQAGEDFALALTDNGILFSWGYNKDGRCGQGGRLTIIPEPTLIHFGNFRVKMFSVGLRHAIAVLENECVYIWGSHSFVHLITNPALRNTYTPKKIPIDEILQGRPGEIDKLDIIRRRKISSEAKMEMEANQSENGGYVFSIINLAPPDCKAKFNQTKIRPDTYYVENNSSIPQDELKWLELLSFIRKFRWKTKFVRCGRGFNLIVVEATPSEPIVKDIVLYWGRSDIGQVGISFGPPKKSENPTPGSENRESVNPFGIRLGVKPTLEKKSKQDKPSSFPPAIVGTPNPFLVKSKAAPTPLPQQSLKEDLPHIQQHDTDKKRLEYRGWFPRLFWFGHPGSIIGGGMHIVDIHVGGDGCVGLIEGPPVGGMLIWGRWKAEVNGGVYRYIRVNHPYYVDLGIQDMNFDEVCTGKGQQIWLFSKRRGAVVVVTTIKLATAAKSPTEAQKDVVFGTSDRLCLVSEVVRTGVHGIRGSGLCPFLVYSCLKAARFR